MKNNSRSKDNIAEQERFDIPQISASSLLIEFYKHASSELSKLIDKDPEKFLYVAAGASGGAILAIATGGVSLPATVVGAVAGALAGVAAVGVKRAFLPTDVLRIQNSADEMIRQLTKLHNADTHFSSLMLRKLEIIAEKVAPNLQGDIPEEEAQKLARQLKSVSKSVDKRIALHSGVADCENNSDRLLEYSERFTKGQRTMLWEKYKEIQPMITALRDGTLRSRDANRLVRKIAKYNSEIEKVLD